MPVFFNPKPSVGPALLKWSGAAGATNLPSAGQVLTPTFGEFITWPDRHDILLAVLRPAELLRGWLQTLDGSGHVVNPNTWYVPFSSRVADSDVEGGLFRQVLRVTENAQDYVRVDTMLTVDSTPGTYFIQSGNLYVHTFAPTETPDNKDAILAYFEIYFATEPIVLNVRGVPVPFCPLLEDRTVASVEDEAEDPLFGLKQIQSGEVGLLNFNGFMSRMYANYFWKNKEVALYFGGRYNGMSLDFGQYRLLSTWVVEDVGPGEDVADFKLKSQTTILQQKIPVTPYDAATYDNPGSGIIGSFKPLWYGTNTVKPDLVDQTGLGIYLLADPAYQTMYALLGVSGINKTSGQKVGLGSSDYIFSAATCELVITNPIYSWNNYDIEVTATGKVNIGGLPITKWADIVHDLLSTFCNQSPDDFDLGSYQTALTNAPQELNLYIKSQVDLLTLFQSGGDTPSLERSVMARLELDSSGRWHFRVWAAPIRGARIAETFNKADFVSFEPQPKLESVFYKVVVLYAYNHARNEWQNAVAASNVTRYANGTEDVVFIYTNLKNYGDASILAQRYRYMWSTIPLEVACQEVGVKSLDLSVGDLVYVNYAPAPNPTKAFVNAEFSVMQMTQTFSKPPVMTFRLNNIRGAPANVGFWVANGWPTWGNSTSNERQSAGYWSDIFGRTDPNDNGTIDASIWW